MQKYVFPFLFLVFHSFSHSGLYSRDSGSTVSLPFEKRSPLQQKTSFQNNRNQSSNPYTVIVGIGLGIYELGKYLFDSTKNTPIDYPGCELVNNSSDFYSWDKHQFKDLFTKNKMLQPSNDLWSSVAKADSQLFQQYNMYQFHGYRDLLEELPGFDQAIKEIKQRYKNDSKFRQSMQRLQGFPKDGFLRQINQWLYKIEAKELLIKKEKEEQKARTAKLAKEQTVRTFLQQQFTQVLGKDLPQLQQFHTNYNTLIQNNVDCPDYIIKRYDAIDQILNNNITWQTKKYDINTSALHLLTTYDINPDLYKECYGNQLQQQLHKEFVREVNVMALKIAYEKNKESIITGMFMEFSGMGILYNLFCRSSDAMSLSDYCLACLDVQETIGSLAHTDQFGAAIHGAGINLTRAAVEGFAYFNSGDLVPFVKGAKQGIKNTYHFFRHLDQSVVGIAKGVGFLWSKLIEKKPLSREVIELYQQGKYAEGDKLGWENCKKDNSSKAWKNYLLPFIKPVKNTPPVLILQKATEIGTEFITTDFAFRSIGRGLSKIGKAITNPEALSFVDRHANRLADFIENPAPHAPQFVTPDGHIITLTPVSDFVIEAAEVTGAVGEVTEGASPLVNVMSQFGKFNKDSEKAVGGGAEKINQTIKKLFCIGNENLTYEQIIQKYQQKFSQLGFKNPCKGFLKHVKTSHLPGGQKAIRGIKSVFQENENFIEIALEAWEKGSIIKKGIKEFDFGRVIGLNKAGLPTTKVRVFLNQTFDGIRTIYPV